jgi:hypothetical protein
VTLPLTFGPSGQDPPVLRCVVRTQVREVVNVMFARRAAVLAAGGVAVAAGLEVATYPLWRNWCLTWGATSAEADEPLPGDDLMTGQSIMTTRAVRVGAPPGAIWPWLVQMGPGRGGAYTYDWIENLAGMGMHSADSILPEFQDLKTGDTFKLGPRGAVLRVEILDPGRVMVLRSDDGNWVWAFVLVPDGSGTRLISRNRIATPDASPVARFVFRYFMEPGSLVMERKMLLGIKDRAERELTPE